MMHTKTPTDDRDIFEGPAWNLHDEYPSVACSEIDQDLATVRTLIHEIKAAKLGARGDAHQPSTIAGLWLKVQKAGILVYNVGTYASCLLSVDGKNDAAKKLASTMDALGTELEAVAKPLQLYLDHLDAASLDQVLVEPGMGTARFSIENSRRMRPFLLSGNEEEAIIALGLDGMKAWWKLYGTLSGSVKAHVRLPSGEQTMGLAPAFALQEHEDEATRRAAYAAVNEAWAQHGETCAAALNSLAGWRHTLARRRSSERKMDFLTPSLHESRIERATLESLLGVLEESAPEVGRRSVYLRARALGKRQLGPWDLFAPPPAIPGTETQQGSQRIPFSQAVQMVARSFGQVSPEMGDFVTMMAERGWIEGTRGDRKRPGAYCTSFAKSRNPRVYMTYTGGMRELLTLAHELGHAFHSWVMRDMSYDELDYPMTLAETASIFGETVVNKNLMQEAKSLPEKLAVAWSDAREAEGFLVNIPMRFHFERSFYEKRPEGTWTPEQFREQMAASWQRYYGDATSEPNEWFWASKLHFYIDDRSFYNYPYSFGYLFALGVYAEKPRLGDKFYGAYVSLLRDTGRMRAEEVAAKHLGVDLSKPDFWRRGVAIAKAKLDAVEGLLNDAGL